jgi:hypothetical protein
MPSELGLIKVGDRLLDLNTGEKYIVKTIHNGIRLSPVRDSLKTFFITREILDNSFRHVWQFEFDKQLKELLNGV